jgi:hypothetical protein
MKIALTTNTNDSMLTHFRDQLMAHSCMDRLSFSLNWPAGAGKTPILKATEKIVMKSVHCV